MTKIWNGWTIVDNYKRKYMRMIMKCLRMMD